MKVLRFGTMRVLLVLLLFKFGYAMTGDFGYAIAVPDIGVEVIEKANYDRLGEVRKSCSSIVHSATDLNLELDDNEINLLKNELSFDNADWEQIGGTAPIMPFDDRPGINSSHVRYKYELSREKSGSKFPYKLVSFKLTDISTKHGSKKSMAINGNLVMVITSNLPVATYFNRAGNEFSMWKGHTQIIINFQGIYAELKNSNGGEKLLCLLGSSLLPLRQSGSSDPWESVKASSSSNISPPLLQDDQILLVVRFPKTASLDRLAIRGEMKSLNPKSNQKYFDEVQMTAQLQAQTHHYEFSPDEVIAKACDPYPYSDASVSGSNELYTGHDFCRMLRKLSTDAAFAVAPHWQCHGTDEFCSKFGPFGFDTKINATDGSFKDVRVLMQNIYCLAENRTSNNEVKAKVFAVFRAFDSPNNLYLENQRSGLDNMTLVAEGIWKSSSGQLCMIGCQGSKDGEKKACNSRICLYIPLSFSIKQRSILIGSISSLETKNPPFYPLSLGMLYQSLDYIYDGYRYKHPYYQYTKIDNAGTVLEKDEPFSFGTVVKRKILTFPRLQDSYDYSESLSLLAEDLTLHVSALPEPLPKSRPSRIDVQMEVLSLGPMFGRYWLSNSSNDNTGIPFHTNASYTEKQLLLNVSTQLKLSGGSYNNFSVIFLEGLYDQHVGKMYLIGCIDVRASWKVLFDSMGISGGLDCQIEVIISYPPTTARWLVTPTASVSITSQRTEDDPFYFTPLKLLTRPVMYRQQREDILSRRSFEGILKILSLSISIACILRQLFYMRDLLADSLPYMSLTMLGSQVIGFALPLVIDAEALSKNSNSQTSETPYNDLERSEWTQVIDYTVKFQVLVCLISTLRLCQIVWKARVRLHAQHPSGPSHAPTEKLVVIITLIIHVLGYLLALIFHSVKTGQTPVWTQQYVDSYGNPSSLKTWETLFQEYTGLLQDLFLLPQVIGNIIWQIESKPLLKIYYMGLTFLRLLPHLYDHYVIGPDVNPFFSEEYEFVNPKFDFFSEFGDIAIPVLALVLAVVVYIQQRWNYEKLSNTLTIGRLRLLPASSRMYEKIPSELAEAELVCNPVRRIVKESDE